MCPNVPNKGGQFYKYITNCSFGHLVSRSKIQYASRLNTFLFQSPPHNSLHNFSIPKKEKLHSDPSCCLCHNLHNTFHLLGNDTVLQV